ncbi:hypothetical protein MIND_01182000 [Mycena indigotica]|uniref:Uncharacterized protein n=1 Tax=Mycena indigotica TaxID=2126181 RepID=A0A8H6S5Y2_9AGAR|nr:uncharacterized protein MIND_01182000 [Mycena indigotica]KAF7292830.1 hypothetical protein MIND_01182000 [Mycena indigotica]
MASVNDRVWRLTCLSEPLVTVSGGLDRELNQRFPRHCSALNDGRVKVASKRNKDTVRLRKPATCLDINRILTDLLPSTYQDVTRNDFKPGQGATMPTITSESGKWVFYEVSCRDQRQGTRHSPPQRARHGVCKPGPTPSSLSLAENEGEVLLVRVLTLSKTIATTSGRGGRRS